MDQKDIDRVQAHLKRTFGNPHIAVKARPKQKDSAEVEVKGEFIGVIYEDEDEAGSFMFEMAILAGGPRRLTARRAVRRQVTPAPRNSRSPASPPPCRTPPSACCPPPPAPSP